MSNKKLRDFTKKFRYYFGRNPDENEIAQYIESMSQNPKNAQTGYSGSMRPVTGMQPGTRMSGTVMPNMPKSTGKGYNPIADFWERQAAVENERRKKAAAIEKRAYDESRDQLKREQKLQDDFRREAIDIETAVNKISDFDVPISPELSEEKDPDKISAYINGWKTAEKQKRLNAIRPYYDVGKKPPVAVKKAVKSKRVMQEEPEPVGEIVTSERGQQKFVPTGEMNGETVYDVYSKYGDSDTWKKRGVSQGKSRTGFIPEGKMGSNKMRMDTFKAALNKYNRDIGYTGEDGLGSRAVKARMEKDWGPDWRDKYLDDQGNSKQLWTDGKGGSTDVDPEISAGVDEIAAGLRTEADEPVPVELPPESERVPPYKDRYKMPQPESPPMYDPLRDRTYENVPSGQDYPEIPAMQPQPVADEYPSSKWDMQRIVSTGSNTVPTIEPQPVENRQERMDRMKNTPNEAMSSGISKRFSAMYPQYYAENEEEPMYVEPPMTPEDEEEILRMEEEAEADQRRKEEILRIRDSMAMAPDNYEFEEGGGYGFY